MKIVKLRPSQRVWDRWLAFLEDGAILRLGSREVAAFGLYAGMELSPELLERLSAAARQGRVRDKALDLIAARPLSRKELTDKLTARPRDREKAAAATAEEAAAAVVFLLSPRSSGIVAQKIVVDAGMAINYFDKKIIESVVKEG